MGRRDARDRSPQARTHYGATAWRRGLARRERSIRAGRRPRGRGDAGASNATAFATPPPTLRLRCSSRAVRRGRRCAPAWNERNRLPSQGFGARVRAARLSAAARGAPIGASRGRAMAVEIRASAAPSTDGSTAPAATSTRSAAATTSVTLDALGVRTSARRLGAARSAARRDGRLAGADAGRAAGDIETGLLVVPVDRRLGGACNARRGSGRAAAAMRARVRRRPARSRPVRGGELARGRRARSAPGSTPARRRISACSARDARAQAGDGGARGPLRVPAPPRIGASPRRRPHRRLASSAAERVEPASSRRGCLPSKSRGAAPTKRAVRDPASERRSYRRAQRLASEHAPASAAAARRTTPRRAPAAQVHQEPPSADARRLHAASSGHASSATARARRGRGRARRSSPRPSCSARSR